MRLQFYCVLESSHIVAAIVAVAASALSAFEIFAGSSYQWSICPTGAKFIRVIGSFEKSKVREIGGKIIELG